MPIPLIVTIDAQILQFAGSLVAILVLAWLVRRMGLGTEPRLQDDTAAIGAANEVSDGFTAIDIARDRYGRGALLRDGDGRIMLMKPHGTHFAGRILSGGASARICTGPGETALEIDCGEQRFGKVGLIIDEPEAWERAVNALNGAGNA